VVVIVAFAALAAAAGCGSDDGATTDATDASTGPAAGSTAGPAGGVAESVATEPLASDTVAPASGSDAVASDVLTDVSGRDGGEEGDTGATDVAPVDEGDGTLPLDRWERHVLDDARPQRAIFITTGDLDEDGDADVVTGPFWYENPGTDDGPWSRHELGSPLYNQAVVHDFDGDGHLDVLGTEGVGSTANADFALAHGDGRGGFEVVASVASARGDFLQGVCVAEFDPAGPLQVALSWHQRGQGVQLLTVPSDPATDPWAWEQIATDSQDEALSCGDIDGDGDVDLLQGTRWLRNDGSEWSPQVVSDVDGAPDRNRLADIDGDGRLDALVGFEAISVEGTLAWYQQPESLDALWQEHVIADDVVGPMSVSAGDVDGDGDPDVVVGEHNLARPDDARLLLYENVDASGSTWPVHTIYQGDEHHDGAELVDIDADGDLDVVSIGWGHGRVVLYENLAR